MAITTLAGVEAGLKPSVFSSQNRSTGNTGAVCMLYGSSATGYPAPAALPSSGLSGAAVTSLTGQYPFSNPVSGNTYLAGYKISTNLRSGCILADLLWQNSGIVVTTTTAQTITSAAFPARDIAQSVNGDGVQLALVNTATVGATPSTAATISYTNQAGTAGRTATVINTPTAVAGNTTLFGLQAGDTGVKSVDSITLSTSLVSGTVSLIAFRVFAMVGAPAESQPYGFDALTGGFPQLFNNTVPFKIDICGSGGGTNIVGELLYAQG